MTQKNLLLAVALIALLVTTGAFWYLSQRQAALNPPVVTDEFVTDVDLDVSHWQTKETEFFTIKFPKEWYWLESDLEKTGYRSRVITNNPEFSIDKYADIGVFSDIGPEVPIVLSNPTEIIITNRSTPTSNSGTPLDSLESIIKLAEFNYSKVECNRPIDEWEALPFIAYCSAVYHENQYQLSYFIIDESWSLTLTARTTKDTLVSRDILEKIARNVKIKD